MLSDGLKNFVKNLIFEVRLLKIQTMLPFPNLVIMYREKKHVPSSWLLCGHVDHFKEKVFLPGFFVQVWNTKVEELNLACFERKKHFRQMTILEHADRAFFEQRVDWFHLWIRAEPFTSSNLLVKLHELVLNKFQNTFVYNLVVRKRLVISIIQQFSCFF